jgi:hypothetical protein
MNLGTLVCVHDVAVGLNRVKEILHEADRKKSGFLRSASNFQLKATKKAKHAERVKSRKHVWIYDKTAKPSLYSRNSTYYL